MSGGLGFAGPDSRVVSAYGATAIPATFLIDPEGKIIAKDLRGDRMKAAVAKVLNSTNGSIPLGAFDRPTGSSRAARHD